MPDLNQPAFAPLWCACKACGHWWDAWQPVHVPVATWIAHTRTLRCPHCGKGQRNVLLRTTPLADKPDGPHAA
jgi:DNA-directed RNA polymerase subunit RPC12/RpoP